MLGRVASLRVAGDLALVFAFVSCLHAMLIDVAGIAARAERDDDAPAASRDVNSLLLAASLT